MGLFVDNSINAARAAQLRAAQFGVSTPFAGGTLKNLYAVKGSLTHPTAKSDFAQELMGNTPLLAEKLDLLG